jgi:hypothetical protein
MTSKPRSTFFTRSSGARKCFLAALAFALAAPWSLAQAQGAAGGSLGCSVVGADQS